MAKKLQNKLAVVRPSALDMSSSYALVWTGMGTQHLCLQN
jgi:hypothetical protein